MSKWTKFRGHGFLGEPSLTPVVDTAALVQALKEPTAKRAFRWPRWVLSAFALLSLTGRLETPGFRRWEVK
jgi:hypothetical protein